MKKYIISFSFFIVFFMIGSVAAQTNTPPAEVTVLKAANPDYKEQKTDPAQAPTSEKTQNPASRTEAQNNNDKATITDQRAKKPE